MEVNEELEISVEDFFAMAASGGTYEVETPDGWIEIGRMKIESKDCYVVRTKNGLSLGASVDHQIFTESGDWVKIEDIQFDQEIITKQGADEIVAKEYLGTRTTYDFEVLHDNHRYYSNGIVSHNCGKTMVGRASATTIAKIHGKEAVDTAFNYVKGPELLSMWVGENEAETRAIFARNKKHYQKHGYPAVTFIDEADALLMERSSGNSTQIHEPWRDTLVAAWLAEMGEPHTMLLLATNRPATLDGAIVRAGRIDRAIKVPRPTLETAPEIFNVHLKNVPVHKTDFREIIGMTLAELSDGNRVLYKVKHLAETEIFTLFNILSGALIKNVIDQAKQFALRRDLREGAWRGVEIPDFQAAVKAVYRQNIALNHRYDLLDFYETKGWDDRQCNVEKLSVRD